MPELTDDWIRQQDERLGGEGTALRHRPGAVFMAWAMEQGHAVSLTGPEMGAIMRWYHANYRKITFDPLYTSVFYYEGQVYPLRVPYVVGTTSIEPEHLLSGMMPIVLDRLRASDRESDRYRRLAQACLYYATDFSSTWTAVGKQSLAGKFMKAADDRLRSSTSSLLSQDPGQAVVDNARLAVEIFLKAFLVHHEGWTEEQVRKRLGHDLGKSMGEVLKRQEGQRLRPLAGELRHFPPVGARYEARRWSLFELGELHQATQEIAAAVVAGLPSTPRRAGQSS